MRCRDSLAFRAGVLDSCHRTLFNTGHVDLGMLLALACALIVNWGLSRLERKIGRWRELERVEI